MSDNIKIITQNKKVRRQYEIVSTYEAGLVLLGSEVKSLRQGRANLADSYAHFEGGDAGPLASTLLPGSVKNLLHDWLAILILETENVAGNLDQIGVQFTFIPFGKDLVHLVGAQPQGILH